MKRLRAVTLFIDILLTAAIAGFFYAYTSTVMRGLDAAPPEVAVPAMQAINANVRNAVFAPGFFGPLVVGIALVVLYGLVNSRAAWLARAGVAVYVVGGFVLTMAVNVPMNEALAPLTATSADEAARIWSDYSPTWTDWNTLRTAFSFLSLALLTLALVSEARARSDG